MKSLLNILSGKKEHLIAVAQYQRDDYGVGTEEHLHWAIIVLTNVEENELRGPCYQVIDRHYSDGRGVVWSIHTKEVSLGKTAKCLGGVHIGSIKQKELKELHEVLTSNPPVVKFTGWNCRDWVMEGIQLMKAKGWIPTDIPLQATLLPSMRRASIATQDAYKACGVPTIVPLEGDNSRYRV